MPCFISFFCKLFLYAGDFLCSSETNIAWIFCNQPTNHHHRHLPGTISCFLAFLLFDVIFRFFVFALKSLQTNKKQIQQILINSSGWLAVLRNFNKVHKCRKRHKRQRETQWWGEKHNNTKMENLKSVDVGKQTTTITTTISASEEDTQLHTTRENADDDDETGKSLWVKNRFGVFLLLDTAPQLLQQWKAFGSFLVFYFDFRAECSSFLSGIFGCYIHFEW